VSRDGISIDMLVHALVFGAAVIGSSHRSKGRQFRQGVIVTAFGRAAVGASTRRRGPQIGGQVMLWLALFRSGRLRALRWRPGERSTCSGGTLTTTS
jgi:hypothetical protein